MVCEAHNGSRCGRFASIGDSSEARVPASYLACPFVPIPILERSDQQLELLPLRPDTRPCDRRLDAGDMHACRQSTDQTMRYLPAAPVGYSRTQSGELFSIKWGWPMP
jgi:hypothetical protein